jgi:dihydroxy-acid dehydratase
VTPPLRSREWFDGDDEVAVLHRVALRSSGLDLGDAPDRADWGDRPIIGIADSSSELNPCNQPLRALAERVRAGVHEAGGIAVTFGVMSLGEDLMKPSAMLYRNLLAMEVEEYLRSYPLDGVVLLANCDKTVPGALMGALSADLPAVLVTAGPRPPATFRGRQVGTGTDLWRAWEDHRTGALDDAGWAEFERCLACGQGSCNTMGTASSMAVLAEALGLALPGSALVPADDPAREQVATEAGRRVVALVADGVLPSAIATDAAFRNAARALHAVGGSTNAVLHLLAMAGRTATRLTLDDVAALGRDVPMIADVEPSGRFLAQDLHAAGGLPAVLAALGDRIETGTLTVSGRTWRQELDARAADPASRPATDRPALRPVDHPLRDGGTFAVVRGSLAPDGALLKASAASPALMRHTGPALVFRSYAEMRDRIDDPELPVTADTVLVLAGAGPVGAPGMPEWGMIPIPAKLAADGVTDLVRVTDARMSGTSFGTCFLHVAPEAAVGGPLALVQDGDPIVVDVGAGRLDLAVDPAELDRRRAALTPPPDEHLRGWPALYRRHVTQADTGCDFDFLQAPTAAHRRFVPPVVGRS